MTTDSLIQQLFAIERALGYVTHEELRVMVIEAQETALESEIRNLREVECLRQRLEDKHRFHLARLFRSKDSGRQRRSA
jgi:hypothetical protein